MAKKKKMTKKEFEAWINEIMPGCKTKEEQRRFEQQVLQYERTHPTPTIIINVAGEA